MKSRKRRTHILRFISIILAIVFFCENTSFAQSQINPKNIAPSSIFANFSKYFKADGILLSPEIELKLFKAFRDISKETFPVSPHKQQDVFRQVNLLDKVTRILGKVDPVFSEFITIKQNTVRIHTEDGNRYFSVEANITQTNGKKASRRIIFYESSRPPVRHLRSLSKTWSEEDEQIARERGFWITSVEPAKKDESPVSVPAEPSIPLQLKEGIVERPALYEYDEEFWKKVEELNPGTLEKVKRILALYFDDTKERKSLGLSGTACLKKGIDYDFISGRSVIVSLKFPVEINGVVMKELVVKGAPFKKSEQDQEYYPVPFPTAELIEMLRQQSGHVEFDSDGYGKFTPIRFDRKDAIFYYKTKKEYDAGRKGFKDRKSRIKILPVMNVRYLEDKAPDGGELGVVVIASPSRTVHFNNDDKNRVGHMLGNLLGQIQESFNYFNSEEIQQRIYAEAADLMRVYGLALRQYHDAGYTHGNPHTGNVVVDMDDYGVHVVDLSDARLKSEMTKEQAFGYQLRDLHYATQDFMRTLNSPGAPFFAIDLAVFALRTFLVNYFGNHGMQLNFASNFQIVKAIDDLNTVIIEMFRPENPGRNRAYSRNILENYLANLVYKIMNTSSNGRDGFVQSKSKYAQAPKDLEQIRHMERKKLKAIKLPQFDQIKSYIEAKLASLQERIDAINEDKKKPQLIRALASANQGLALLAKLHSEGKIYSFKSIVYRQEDYALAYGDKDEMGISEELLDLPLELLAELLFHEAICYKEGHDEAKQIQCSVFIENYDRPDYYYQSKLKSKLREFINYKARTLDGIDYFELIKKLTNNQENIGTVFIEKNNDRAEELFLSILRDLVQKNKICVFTGDVSFCSSFLHSLYSDNSYGRGPSKEQIASSTKVLVYKDYGVVGVTGIPAEINQKIKDAIQTDNAPRFVNLMQLFILINLYNSGYAHLDSVIEDYVKTEKLSISYEDFIKLVECCVAHKKEHEDLRMQEHELEREANPDHKERLDEIRSKNQEMMTNVFAEKSMLGSFLTQIPEDILKEYLRKLIIEYKGEKIASKHALEDLIKDERSSYRENEKFTAYLWDFYLDPDNTSSENEIFRKYLLNLIGSYEKDIESAIRKISSIFKEGELNKCYKAMEVLLRLEITKDNLDDVFEVLEHAPYRRQVLAAFALANFTLMGPKEKEIYRGYARIDLNPFLRYMSPEMLHVYFYMLRMYDIREKGGTFNQDVNRRIINLTIALDNHAGAPGTEGYSWFTSLRSGVHTNASSYDLDVVRLLLYHLKDKHLTAIESEYKSLAQAIPDFFSGDGLDLYSKILNSALRDLQSQGYLDSLKKDNFLNEFNRIPLETVTDAIKKAGEAILGQDLKKEYKDDFISELKSIDNSLKYLLEKGRVKFIKNSFMVEFSKEIQRLSEQAEEAIETIADSQEYKKYLLGLFEDITKKATDSIFVENEEDRHKEPAVRDIYHSLDRITRYYYRDTAYEKLGNIIRLFYALTERYGSMEANIIPKIKGEFTGGDDDEDSWMVERKKEEMTEATEFMRKEYDALIEVLESKDDQLVLQHVAQCRMLIKNHFLFSKMEDDDMVELRGETNVKRKLMDLDQNLYIFGKERVIRLLKIVEQCKTMEDLKVHINTLAGIGKFMFASGLGGVEFEQLILELEKDNLTYSQVHDLVRALRTEVHKITRNINESMRYATEHIWDHLHYYELTKEWQKIAKVIRTEDEYGGEETVITEEGREEIVNEMVDTLIRDTQVLSFDQMLARFSEILETQLTPTNNEMVAERTVAPLVLSDQFYRFGQPEVIPRDKLLSLWSKKGLNLVEMTEKNIQVPPGVILSSRLLTRPDIFKSPEFRGEVEKEIQLIRKYSKYPDLKFLLYARSGSAFTLPGLLMTIPNLGMNDKEAEDLAQTTGDLWFAYDTYAEFIRSYAINILGIPEEYFQDILNVYQKDQISGEEMKVVVERYKKLVIEKYSEIHGKANEAMAFNEIIPENMLDQVMLAIDAVYASWDSEDARAYREQHKISQEWGTVVILQKGIFGNLDVTEDGRISGTGFGVLRTMPDGREIVQGKFRFRAFGDQLMSRADQNYVLISNSQRFENEQTLEDLQPELYEQILKRAHELKNIFGNNQQFEFVIELNNLWITQSNDDYITDEYPEFVNAEEYEVMGRGHGVSAGAFRGWAANSIEKARELIEKYNTEKPDAVDGVVLFLNRVNPELINMIPKGVAICAKIISVHAETLAQKGGIPSVYGVSGMEHNDNESVWYINGKKIEDGMVLSIDGHENQLVYHNSGNIFMGSVPITKKTDGKTEVERRTPRALDRIRELREQEMIDEALANQKISLTNFEKEILVAFEKFMKGDLQKSTIDRYTVSYSIVLDKIAVFCKDLDFELYGDEFKHTLTEKLLELGVSFEVFSELQKNYHPRGKKSVEVLQKIGYRLNFVPSEVTEPGRTIIYSAKGERLEVDTTAMLNTRFPFSGNEFIVNPLSKPVKLVSFELDDVLSQLLDFGGMDDVLALFRQIKAMGCKIAITSMNPNVLRWYLGASQVVEELKQLVDYCEMDKTYVDLERYVERLGIERDEIIHFGNWWGAGLFESTSAAARIHNNGFKSVMVCNRNFIYNEKDLTNKEIDAVIFGRLTGENIINILESYRWGMQANQSGALKDIGPALDEETVKEAQQKEVDWKRLARNVSVSEYTRLKIKAKVVQVNNLPAGLNAWHLLDNGTLIIVLRNVPEQIPYLDELIYHESREAYWISKGLTQRNAHIIASYEQVLAFQEDAKLTLYHQKQIDSMSVKELDSLINEYGSGEREKMHYKLLKENIASFQKIFGQDVETRIKNYENLVISRAKSLKDRKIKISNNAVTYAIPEKIAERVRRCEASVKNIRTIVTQTRQVTLEMPLDSTADQTVFMMKADVKDSSLKTSLLINLDLLQIFNYHSIRYMVIDDNCEVGLFDIVAHLGALQEQGIILGNNEGFKFKNGDYCIRNADRLIVTKKIEQRPDILFKAKYEIHILSPLEQSVSDALRDARKCLTENDARKARQILTDLEDKIQESKISNDLMHQYHVLLGETNMEFNRILKEISLFISQKKHNKAVKLAISIYEDFKTDKEFISLVDSLEEYLPVVFKLRLRIDRARAQGSKETLKDILLDLGFDSPNRFLTWARANKSGKEAEEYLREIFIRTFYDNFGATRKTVIALGYSQKNQKIFFILVKNLGINLSSIDLEPVKRLREKVKDLKTKQRDKLLSRAVHELGLPRFLEFSDRFGKAEGFNEFIRELIIEVIQTKGKYKPFICKYLGVSWEYVYRKLEEYGIEIDSIEHNEDKRLQEAITKVGLDKDSPYDFEKIVKTMGYPGIYEFLLTYRHDAKIQKVLKEFLIKVLQKYGGSIPYCMKQTNIMPDVFRDLLSLLEIDIDTLEYDEAKRLRKEIDRAKIQEIKNKGAISKINTTDIEYLNLNNAMQNMGWSNFGELIKMHGDNADLRKVLKDIFEEALRLVLGNQVAAEKLLGIEATTFYRWKEKLGIDIETLLETREDGPAPVKSIAERFREALANLPKGQNERLDLAAYALGFGKNPDYSIRYFMMKYGEDPAVRELVKATIVKALVGQGGSLEPAARRLGMTSNGVRKYMVLFEIDKDKLPYDELGRFKTACENCGDEIPNLEKIIQQLGYHNMNRFMIHNRDNADAFLQYLIEIAKKALLKTSGNAQKAADMLGISEQFMYKLVKYSKGQPQSILGLADIVNDNGIPESTEPTMTNTGTKDIQSELENLIRNEKGYFVGENIESEGPITAAYFDWGGTLSSLTRDERKQLLEYLKSLGLELHILTEGASIDGVAAELDGDGVLSLFSSIVWTESTGYRPWIYQHPKYQDIQMILSGVNKKSYLEKNVKDTRAIMFDDEGRNFAYVPKNIVRVGVVVKGEQKTEGLFGGGDSRMANFYLYSLHDIDSVMSIMDRVQDKKAIKEEDVLTKLESNIKQEKDIESALSEAGSLAQKIHNNTKLQVAIPIDVLKSAPDFSLALNKMKMLGGGDTVFELIIYGLENEIDGDTFIQQLQLPANVRIYSVKADEIKDPTNMNEVKAVLGKKFPINKDDHLIVLTNAVQESEASILQEKITKLANGWKDTSFGIIVRPENNGIISLAKVLAELLANLDNNGTAIVKIILPVILTSADIKQKIEEDVSALWEFLRSA
jgi:hypothetical protein